MSENERQEVIPICKSFHTSAKMLSDKYAMWIFVISTFKSKVQFCELDCCFYRRFLSELGRHNYVTPTSYLELIAAFRLLLTQNRDTVMKAKQRYTNGLDKLAFAESQVYSFTGISCLFVGPKLFKNSYHLYNVSLQVGEMKKELVDLQPKLEQAKIENTNMMKVKTHLKSAS